MQHAKKRTVSTIAAVVILILGLGGFSVAAVAAAETENQLLDEDPYSTTSTTQPDDPVDPGGDPDDPADPAGDPEITQASATNATGTSLPFTGGDVIALAGIAFGLIAFGAATYILGRSRRDANSASN